jgi:CheY-like chemotaxis protein
MATVLLVEDQIELRAIHGAYLEKHGFRVLTAGDGNAALATVTGGRIPGGRIDMHWKPNGLYSSRRSGTDEQRWLNTVWRSNGSMRSRSATASGTIVDVSVSDGWGNIASAHNMTMQFERNRGN